MAPPGVLPVDPSAKALAEVLPPGDSDQKQSADTPADSRPVRKDDASATEQWGQAGGSRAVTCDAIESSCSRSVSSSSNHILKECAGPGLGRWRRGISYGLNLICGSRYRNLAPPFASARDAAGTLPGPRLVVNRMEVA